MFLRLGSALSTAGGSFGIFDGNVLALSLRAVQSNSRSKVISTPRIIPLIGWIFSSKADSNEQRIMYILLTAHIIRPL